MVLCLAGIGDTDAVERAAARAPGYRAGISAAARVRAVRPQTRGVPLRHMGAIDAHARWRNTFRDRA